MKTSTHILTDQEHATVLAALRYYQLNGLDRYPTPRPDPIHDIAMGDGRAFATSLDHLGIDRLCERLNSAASGATDSGPEPLRSIPRYVVVLLNEVSRSCKIPAPCGIASYAIGEKRMRRLRLLVRRLVRSGGECIDRSPLLVAAKVLLENADDRGETSDRDTGKDYDDWFALRQAVDAEEMAS
ncbi:MAG: hypothetical protein JWM32_3117 [Verrucomicrobia bacterium]|nr:hypothetical protein [Verrucomicrobiota bacterium]